MSYDPDDNPGEVFPECRRIGCHSRCPATAQENGHEIRCQCECHAEVTAAAVDLIRSRVERGRVLLEIAEGDIAAGVPAQRVRPALGRIGLELELAERELNAIETEEEAQP